MHDVDNPRTDHDLSHFVFDCGQIGRVKTLSHTVVLPGDSVDIDAIGALRLSPLKRGLTIDSKVDLVSFYIPFRHVYGQKWIDFIKAGVNGSPLDNYFINVKSDAWAVNFLGISKGEGTNANKIPRWLYQSYLNIWNNFYKVPTDPDYTTDPQVMSFEDAKYGIPACHLESIWSAPLPLKARREFNMPISSQLDIMKLKQEYAKLNTIQERDFFMSRYRDIIRDAGGYVDTDADQRPTMLMRTEFWASGYDVDGTAQSTMGQFSGRVQQSWRHSVPRFFVPEHGVIMTLALVRFPPIHSWEIPYHASSGFSPTYLNLAGDSSLVANQPPTQIAISDVITAGTSSNKFNIAFGQWFRYSPNYVNEQYAYLNGYPFLNNLINVNTDPNGLTTQSYVDSSDYNDMFETTQLGHWNLQCKFNVHVDRNLPTARESIMTSN